MIQIPFNPQSASDQSFKIRLGSELVTLSLTFNTRAGFWYLDVQNEAQESLTSLKVVPNWPLMREYAGFKPIQGDFFVFPLNNSAPISVDYDSLGVSWGLYWATEEEYAEWAVNYGLR